MFPKFEILVMLILIMCGRMVNGEWSFEGLKPKCRDQLGTALCQQLDAPIDIYQVDYECCFDYFDKCSQDHCLDENVIYDPRCSNNQSVPGRNQKLREYCSFLISTI